MGTNASEGGATAQLQTREWSVADWLEDMRPPQLTPICMGLWVQDQRMSLLLQFHCQRQCGVASKL